MKKVLTRTILLPLLGVPGLLGACASHESLDATLWLQTAAERRALCLGTFAGASDALLEAQADSAWIAATEQLDGDAAGLPGAIIVDIDETILDNSPYQARLIKERESEFDPELWTQWVLLGEARPLPGAIEFLARADDAGVTVFYVSNRTWSPAAEEATRRNLADLGAPLADDEDTVLLRGEREGWDGDKSSRRRVVADGYRILLMLGDDLNDFVSARDLDLAERAALVERYREWWGERWFVLPNPTYGSWEDAIGGDGKKHVFLRGFESPEESPEPASETPAAQEPAQDQAQADATK